VLSFSCICGALTSDENEPPGTNCVAYPLSLLIAAEAGIGVNAAAFMSQTDGAGRTAWLASYFSPDYPQTLENHEVIKDIASRELNEDFTPMYRCPECERIALKEAGGWTFYRPDTAPLKRHRHTFRSADGNVLDLDPGDEAYSVLAFPERMLSTVLLVSLVEHAAETYLETVVYEGGNRGVAWSSLIDGTHGPVVRTLSAEYMALIKREIERDDGVLHEYVTIPPDPGRWVLRELARLAGLRSLRRRLTRSFRALAGGFRGGAIEPDTGRFYVRIGQKAWPILVTVFPFGIGLRYVLRIGEIKEAEVIEYLRQSPHLPSVAEDARDPRPAE
jgi:hypothetical protein